MFITFEGPEGSGKTTQIRLLADWLIAQGRGVLITREPGGTRIGNGIRALLLDNDHTEMIPRTETLLFNAARAQIVHQVIRPGLEAGQIVLCDRFADSTLAYQGYGYGQDRAELARLIHYATGGLLPDLTLFLDVKPEVGLARKQAGRAQEWNRLDARTIAFHRAVYAGYWEMIGADPERWRVIDSEQPAPTVHQAIVAVLAERLRMKESL
ncbi:MAG: dTMP kinase [Caldilineaceae bacterium]|nr:dTMP kinase [Caldilineaceae bacterium]